MCCAWRIGGADVIHFRNATDKPDFSRLPRFYTSDPDYDAFVNEWFMRHLSVDERGVYYGSGVCLGMVDHMWVVDWDAWMLPWIDRAAMGKTRQGGSDCDVILTTIRDCAVDKYGYVFGARLCASQQLTRRLQAYVRLALPSTTATRSSDAPPGGSSTIPTTAQEASGSFMTSISRPGT